MTLHGEVRRIDGLPHLVITAREGDAEIARARALALRDFSAEDVAMLIAGLSDRLNGR